MDVGTTEQGISAKRPRPRRRIIKRLLILFSVGCMLLFILAIAGIYDITAPYRYKWQLKDRLSQVVTLQQSKDAAGYLGVTLEHGNNEWTVIAYKDAHNFGHPSVAIAKMSNGKLFESDLHHCGLFKGYRSLRTDYAEWSEQTPEEYFSQYGERFVLLSQIESEQDMSRRIQLLQDLGFEPVE